MNHRQVSAAMIAACLAAPLLSAAQAATPLKPITHETLWMMKRVGAPIVRPDGQPAPNERVAVLICGGNTTAVDFER
jgi:5-enolpyruvylshikimate-3-phosphate synthase